MEKGKEKDLLMQKLKKGVSKRRKYLRTELRRIVLTRYLKSTGWKGEDIEGLLKSVKVNFWSAIGYSKAVSNTLKSTSEQRAMIWSLIHRYSKSYEQQDN